MNRPDNMPEILDLERTAEQRMRLVDACPDDQASAAAAQRLLALAADLRRPETATLLTELRAIHGWLDESGASDDFLTQAEAYRFAIGFTQHPKDAEAYVRTMIDLARAAAEGR